MEKALRWMAEHVCQLTIETVGSLEEGSSECVKMVYATLDLFDPQTKRAFQARRQIKYEELARRPAPGSLVLTDLVEQLIEEAELKIQGAE